MTSNKLIRRFIPCALVITIILGAGYVGIQQVLRQDANDPQIELSEDLGGALAAGEPTDDLKQSQPVDMATSLTPFFIVFDASQKVVVATGMLNGQTPTPPAGVLDAAKAAGQNRITWQPAPGVRVAAVIKYYQGSNASGYVLIGRSLREVEKRETALAYPFAGAWLLSLLVVFIALALPNKKNEAINTPPKPPVVAMV